MKSTITICLCALLVLEGCTSYFVLDEDERSQPGALEDEDIRITLQNGEQIESERGCHVEVTEPSDFVFGVGYAGKVVGKDRFGSTSVFRGRILRSSIDSTRLILYHSERVLRCFLSDGLVVSFRQGAYGTITPDSGTGFWLLVAKNDSNFVRKIDVNSLEENQVEVNKVSAVKTALLVLPSCLFVGMILWGPSFWNGY